MVGLKILIFCLFSGISFAQTKIAFIGDTGVGRDFQTSMVK